MTTRIPFRPRRRQHGLGLISLMAGMLLSVLGVLSLLMLYRTLVGQTVQSRARAAEDGSYATATLSAQMELHNAGYGIGSNSTRAAVNTDLILVSGAALDANGRLSGTAQTVGASGVSTGNAVIWGAQPGVAYECSALLMQSATLMLLRASGSCSSATQWGTATWTRSADLIPAGTMTLASNNVFRVDRATCWPYGLGAATALRVTIWGDDSVWMTSACLTNFSGA